ncbi:hypothetical protein FS842_007421 [Serendipita sp. 407]|nr:hypothetical protein FS842_007421 [Serendipita sp. 407]
MFQLWIALTAVVPSLCLDSTTMQAHLKAGEKLLGTYQASSSITSRWMSAYNDSTLVQNLNLPGTHDSLTWSVSAVLSPFVQTQDITLFQQLNNGVRFVDLRIGIVSEKLRLFHASYQLSSSVELVDIFWGLYHWLDQNPTETVLVSVKVDNGNSTAALQRQVYDLMNGPEVSDYWVHNTTLPALGDARHKLIPILRLTMDPNNIPDYKPFGLNLARGWKDNNANISIKYDYDADNNYRQVVYVQDLYNPDADDEEAAINKKYEVLTTHLNRSVATGFENTNKWYIGFASGYNGVLTTPKQLALGSTIPRTVGVNTLIRPYLQSNRGSYFGVIMFDFIGSDQRLINATLGWETSWGTKTFTVTSPILSAMIVIVASLLVF